jgi:hypothetical protein
MSNIITTLYIYEYEPEITVRRNTNYGLDDWDSIFGRGRDFLSRVQIGFGARSFFYPMDKATGV